MSKLVMAGSGPDALNLELLKKMTTPKEEAFGNEDATMADKEED